jgi:hypothetical protein
MSMAYLRVRARRSTVLLKGPSPATLRFVHVRPIQRTAPANGCRSELSPYRVDRSIKHLLTFACFTVKEVALLAVIRLNRRAPTPSRWMGSRSREGDPWIHGLKAEKGSRWHSIEPGVLWYRDLRRPLRESAVG